MFYFNPVSEIWLTDLQNISPNLKGAYFMKYFGWVTKIDDKIQ